MNSGRQLSLVIRIDDLRTRLRTAVSGPSMVSEFLAVLVGAGEQQMIPAVWADPPRDK